ncbi:MAG: WecB/TagA/CpsF family glycosyltransferase, partial [Vampirovibrio sp.]|nr:WecB/TagA/CpsF family glycosyltransferase [Vampirovibrio sp.]
MNPFPTSLTIEDIELAAFDSPDSLFHRIIHEIRRPKQSILSYLNVHVANQAVQDRRLKLLLQDADCVYCDGAGIKLGAKMLGKHIPTRLTAADWFLEMLATLSEAKCSVYILGGMPGVPEKMMDVLREKLPAHSVMGMHHGFIL